MPVVAAVIAAVFFEYRYVMFYSTASIFMLYALIDDGLMNEYRHITIAGPASKTLTLLL
jgi:hypothetical protein